MPAEAVALNLTLTVVVDVPDGCVNVTELEKAPPLTVLTETSKPAGAVKTMLLFVVVNVPETVKVCTPDAVPTQALKPVKFAVLVIVPEPPA